MAKFPVNPGDSDSAITDAINSLLSGPSGLGQNFKGFSNPVVGNGPPMNVSAYLTGNYRPPFTQQAPAATYVTPIALATSEYLDPRTIKFTYAAAQATAPFALGNGPEVVGTSIPAVYDGVYGGTGVVKSTTTYCVVRITGDGTTPASATGGTIAYNPFVSGSFVSTDANAKVTVNGGTDRVFVSAQLNSRLTYQATVPSNIIYSVMINRYYGKSNSDPTNPDFVFIPDTTIAVKNYYITVDNTQTGLITNGQSFSGTKAVSTYPYTYSVIPNTVTGSGTVGLLNITLSAGALAAYNSTNTDITVVGAGGHGYAVGDTLLVPGSKLGGVDGVNDMSLTVTMVTTGTATLPPTTFANWYGPVEIETTFTAVIDTPPLNYYWYITELEVDQLDGDAVIDQVEFGYRTLSAQVVKA